jgi:hypothetical protein
MLDKKTQALGKLGDGLQRVVDAVMSQLPKESPTPEQEKEINRLRGLTKLARRVPVWPFDTVTLRRFFTAYLVPVIAWVLADSPLHDGIGRMFDRTLNGPTTTLQQPAPTNAPPLALSGHTTNSVAPANTPNPSASTNAVVPTNPTPKK